MLPPMRNPGGPRFAFGQPTGLSDGCVECNPGFFAQSRIAVGGSFIEETIDVLSIVGQDGRAHSHERAP